MKKVKKTKKTIVAVRLEEGVRLVSFPSRTNARAFMKDLAKIGIESAMTLGLAK